MCILPPALHPPPPRHRERSAAISRGTGVAAPPLGARNDASTTRLFRTEVDLVPVLLKQRILFSLRKVFGHHFSAHLSHCDFRHPT